VTSANPRLRASDADRDRVAALLREHLAAGRLTTDEFQERLSATFAAKTMGELDELMADLPAIDLYQLPGHSVAPPGHSAVARQSANDVMARTTAIGVAIALYVVSGAAFGVWWIPWWIIILVVAIYTARRSQRG
jgi:uncharacterized membrane protein